MARDDGTFEVAIIAENGVVYEGRCEVLMVPGVKMPMAILAYHTPMIAKLGEGQVSIRNGRRSETVAQITSGVVQVGDNVATVLLNL